MIRENLVQGDDLLGSVKDVLDRKGVTSQIKARIRAEVYHALEDKTVSAPTKPKGVYLASEIMKDFLQNMKYSSTLSVFSEEVGVSEDGPVDRDFILHELGLNGAETDRSIPLIMLLVNHLAKNKDQVLRERLDEAAKVKVSPDGTP